MARREKSLKALMRGIDLLILDEQTSNLKPIETDGLFGVFRNIKAAGKA